MNLRPGPLLLLGSLALPLPAVAIDILTVYELALANDAAFGADAANYRAQQQAPTTARSLLLPNLSASAGAGRVTGVEVNGAVIRALEGPFREPLGLERPGAPLRIEHDDGRSFARRFTDRFDVIQMTGADTYAAAPADE